MALEMYAYKRYAAVAKYSGSDRCVVIPQYYKGLPVTEIQEGAFSGTPVEAVFIPDSLVAIGDKAFADCCCLRYIGCSHLRDEEFTVSEEKPEVPVRMGTPIPFVSIFPKNLRMVGAGAFQNTALVSVEFETVFLKLGDSAFEGCFRLETVSILECENMPLGKRVFMNSTLNRLYAPKVRMDPVPDETFANCIELTTLVAYVIAVGNRSFYRCEKLKRLFASKPLRSIGVEAFEGCRALTVFGKTGKQTGVDAQPAGPLQEESPELHQQRTMLVDTLQQIRDKKVEAENMKEHSQSQYGKTGICEGHLFELELESGQLRKYPSVVKGSFVNGGSTLYFQVSMPSAFFGTRLQIMPGEKLSNIRSLLNYVAKMSVEVILFGVQSGNRYNVQDISLEPELCGRDSVVSKVFQEAKKRLKRPITEKKAARVAQVSSAMTTETEYEAMIEICGSRIPEWVLSAYQRNKSILNSTSSGMDARKHAKKAIEILMNIDWASQSLQIPKIEEVRKILDSCFYGMEAVKDRVLEITAQILMTGELPKWGILLAGPAGTGKTSVAKAIASILSLPLIQMDMSSLGTDPDATSGSSRVYSNAQPGMLLENMERIRSSTAVLLANELDKAAEGKSSRSAADILLTILDKTGFYENFLGEIIPTDNLFCIATCNDLSKISKPLRDRFMVIEIPGYTPGEKKVIFHDYVLPSMMKRNGIAADRMSVAEEAVDCLVSAYAQEPGARDLEQFAERLIGDFCVAAAKDPMHKKCYSVEDVRQLFGPGKTVVRHIAIHPGEVNSAFYYDGKAHFFLIEASVFPGTGQFQVLGPVSKLQEEYCKVAYLCVRNTTNASACDLAKCDVTVFISQPIPEGPENYVGFACYAAICSKILNQSLALQEACFVGGCDLNGSLYFDECTLTPLLRSMEAAGITTLYAPMRTNQLIDPVKDGNSGVTVVEAPDATTLFRLAVGCL